MRGQFGLDLLLGIFLFLSLFALYSYSNMALYRESQQALGYILCGTASSAVGNMKALAESVGAEINLPEADFVRIIDTGGQGVVALTIFYTGGYSKIECKRRVIS